MSTLKEALARRIPARRETIARLVKEHGDTVISEVTVKQAYGGMRGVKGLVCDTSLVDPIKGLVIRGIPIAELTDRTAEEILFLLMWGRCPTGRSSRPSRGTCSPGPRSRATSGTCCGPCPTRPPMDMLVTAITILEDLSVFRRRYDEDAGSGALLYHYGITEMRFYTVLFSVSRAMGICAQLVTSRAMMEPITRPKSVSTRWMEDFVGQSAERRKEALA